jgi:hypothetical protein
MECYFNFRYLIKFPDCVGFEEFPNFLLSFPVSTNMIDDDDDDDEGVGKCFAGKVSRLEVLYLLLFKALIWFL